MSGKYTRPWNTTGWFLTRPNYIIFMVRELTAVGVLLYLIMLLSFLAKLSPDQKEQFAALLSDLTTPKWIVLHILALAAAVWHAITWFNLTPKAMPVFIGENKAPGAAVAIAMGYAPWAALSILII